MRRQYDRFLPTQQSRQYRPPAGRQGTGQIGGQQRERARQDVREDQIMLPPAQAAAAISGRVAKPHQQCHTVARDVVAGDRDRAWIDITRPHLTLQQLGCRDRQDAGAGADIERSGDAPTPG